MVSEESCEYTAIELARLRLRARPSFVDSTPEPVMRYVSWVDVMGGDSIMRRSLNIAANFVMKLHACALESSVLHPVDLYPMIDGLYACAPNQGNLFGFLSDTFWNLAIEFTGSGEMLHKFLVRAAVAYGPVLNGADSTGGCETLIGNESYCKKILMGMPLAQAHKSEEQAPPFGVYLHESVRAFAPAEHKPLTTIYWKWWKMPTDLRRELATVETLKQKLSDYFKWCQDHSVSLLYPEADILKHIKSCNEYFMEL